MNLMILDLVLLGLFFVFVVGFLYVKRKNLKKEGLLFLYKTKWGIKLINQIGKKYPKTLKVIGYISIITGYILMVLMIYFFIQIVWIYLFNAEIVRAVKLPPVAPLIPYLPQIFKLDFLPPFYFIHWIVILAIVAISHEFFHGIFAALYKIKIKRTGFGFFPFFLPVFLAAFVELDEKVMKKKSSFKQRVVLSAGTFANILTAILGLILIFGFFSLSFSPSGVIFDDYAYSIVETSSITALNGIALSNPTYEDISKLMNEDGKNYFVVDNMTYVGLKGYNSDKTILALYYSSPAINSEMYGPILNVNGNSVNSLDSFKEELSKYSIGEKITIQTKVNDGIKNYEIVLEENPTESGKAWLGVSFSEASSRSVMQRFILFFSSYKQPHVYYEPDFEGATFIYDLLWWLILISFSVALVNMLPVGIFDGGRFFYLTVLSITKSAKIAKNSFKVLTYIFLVLLFVLMFMWAKSFF